MKITNDLTLLERVTELSQSMLVAALDGEWATVQDLDAQRQEMLRALPDMSAIPDAQRDTVLAELEKSLEMTNKIKLLCQSSRSKTSEDFQMVNRGRKAAAAYAKY